MERSLLSVNEHQRFLAFHKHREDPYSFIAVTPKASFRAFQKRHGDPVYLPGADSSSGDLQKQ